ncbi:hypothetical protein FG152_24680 [Ochrobactrum sp. XJ1]|nr:hypothetical protein [Ochrobactrum sp. XJ1]
MMQLNLFDLLHKPAVIRPVSFEAGVIQGEAAVTLFLPHKRMAWHQAEIELHPHTDGSWMWSTSYQTSNRGSGYKVGAKWGKFAQSKEDAFFYACKEMQEQLKAIPGHEVKLISEWLNSLSLNSLAV